MEMDHLQAQSQTMTNQGNGGSYSRATCPGTTGRMNLQYLRTLVVPNQPISYGNLIGTSNQPNCTSDSHQEHLEESPCVNGSISLEGKQSILTESSCLSIVFQLIQRERRAWETQKLVLEELKQSGKLSQALSGLQPGDPLREQLLSFLSTGNVSWPNTETTSKGCLLLSDPGRTTRLSSSIKGSEMKSEVDKHCCSLTINISHPFTSPPCKTMGLSINEPNSLAEEVNQTCPKATYAIDSTVMADVDLPNQPASTDTPAKGVVKPGMERHHVVKEFEKEDFGMWPKYLPHNLWTTDADLMVTAAEWTLLVDPLPRPSQCEWGNLAARQTVTEHPVRATAERLSRDLAGDPKHIHKHKYDRKAHLAGDPKIKG